MWGQRVYGQSLDLPLNFSVNLKLLLKITSILQCPIRVFFNKLICFNSFWKKKKSPVGPLCNSRQFRHLALPFSSLIETSGCPVNLSCRFRYLGTWGDFSFFQSCDPKLPDTWCPSSLSFHPPPIYLAASLLRPMRLTLQMVWTWFPTQPVCKPSP